MSSLTREPSSRYRVRDQRRQSPRPTTARASLSAYDAGTPFLRLLHQLDPKCGAANLRRGLQHKASDATAEGEQERDGTLQGKGQKTRDERGHELAVESKNA